MAAMTGLLAALLLVCAQTAAVTAAGTGDVMAARLSATGGKYEICVSHW